EPDVAASVGIGEQQIERVMQRAVAADGDHAPDARRERGGDRRRGGGSLAAADDARGAKSAHALAERRPDARGAARLGPRIDDEQYVLQRAFSLSLRKRRALERARRARSS